MSLGEYLGAGSGVTKLLLHLNGNSNDASGNSNNGTDANITYSQANGRFGQGAGFNGSSSQIYRQSNDFDFFNQAPYTQSIWFKLTSLPASGKRMHPIMTQNGTDTGTYDKGIKIYANGSIAFYTWDGALKDALSASSVIAAGNWYHALGTYDGTNLKIYVNGSLMGTLGASQTYNHTNPRIMLSHAHSGDTEIVYFNGAIDEVIIENRAWSAEEIKRYYTFALGRFAAV